MTKVLTIRLDPELLGRAEARAARLGLDRAKYVRSLIEEDLASGSGESGRKFASEDLAGSYEGCGRSASNMEARERLRKRRLCLPPSGPPIPRAISRSMAAQWLAFPCIRASPTCF